MIAFASGRGLCALEFLDPHRLERFESKLAHWFAPLTIVDEPEHPILGSTERWLSEYFEGAGADSRQVSIDLRGSAFGLAVWKRLLDILPGATRTYGDVARELGKPNGARGRPRCRRQPLSASSSPVIA